ncbi:hypothetical protein EJA70_00785 [Pseudomonas sp. PB103]|jgi:hypothetical protein|uniref:hypothetical protein n=1 Tax=Pseudomonas sp. PB103 TaxID=2494698 RepID=UPI00131C4243|nr:hypothetical protein [Pseudomonas sp. PB103]KAE9648823.1 hypothetical protein EJA70_00785 [Pseudomonas sp. PB103]
MAVIMLAGTGKISNAIAQTLVLTAGATDSISLVVLGRKLEHAEQTLGQAQAIASCSGRKITGEAYAVDWQDPQSVRPALEQWEPDLVVQMASEQPPSELGNDDAWSQLVKDAGFGITLPLHLPPLRTVCLAIESLGKRIPVLNACFPDLVNPVAARLGWPVVGGFGNLATVAAIVRAQWPAVENARFFGCHHHLSRFLNKNLELEHMPRCFTAHDEVTPLELLKVLRSAPKPADISTLTAATATSMIRALCGLDAYWKGIVSGPQGKVGGFPAEIKSKAFELDVEGLDFPALEQWNIAQESGDGVLVNQNLEYTPAAVELIRRHVPHFKASWSVDDISISTLIDMTRQLKNRLKSLG